MEDLLKFNFSDMKRLAFDCGAAADQMPFIMAMALNEAAKDNKGAQEKEMDSSFDRPTPFTRRAFRIEYAKKDRLRVVLAAKDIQNEYLKYGAFGGVRKPKKKALITPGKNVKLNGYGNLPRTFLTKRLSRADVFVGKPMGHRDKPAGVYQRLGGRAGKSRKGREKLRLLVSFSDSHEYDAVYNFSDVFAEGMKKSVLENMHGATVRAMKSRRGRR